MNPLNSSARDGAEREAGARRGDKGGAEDFARQLGEFAPTAAELSTELGGELRRLSRRRFVELEQVRAFHEWLELKRLARRACRVVGESRTGKTVACETYRLRHQPVQPAGGPPTVPVIYIVPPEECGPKELFVSILEYLQYQLGHGSVADGRASVRRVLAVCGVEMLIIDEAQRLRPKTFSDVRDLHDQLEMSVVLVGTDRLDTVIKRDEQVHNRFLACHRFSRLVGEQLALTCAAWEEHVLKLPEDSALDGKAMQKVLEPATRGYIGPLDEILREAAMRALKGGRKRIDLATLQAVAAEYR